MHIPAHEIGRIGDPVPLGTAPPLIALILIRKRLSVAFGLDTVK